MKTFCEDFGPGLCDDISIVPDVWHPLSLDHVSMPFLAEERRKHQYLSRKLLALFDTCRAFEVHFWSFFL